VATERLYGRNAVLESLRAGRRRPRRLLLADGLQPDERIDEISGRAGSLGLSVERLSRAALDDLAPSGHQGVVLETSGYPYAREVPEGAPGPESILLALDELEDPRNVGSLLRTAEAAGVDGVVLPERRSVAITPAVVNASSGAVEHLLVTPASWATGSSGSMAEQNPRTCSTPTCRCPPWWWSARRDAGCAA
jgi:23S rRNA (guanosine2251-2'-O)-methyltransferase